MTALPPLPVWIAAAAIATLFAHAGLAKLGDRGLFEQHLAAYRIPASWLGAGVWLLPLAELATAVLLLTPLRGVGSTLAVGLLLAYASAMAWHRAHGRALDCGCGGEPLPVSWALVARNGVLAAIAALAGAEMAPGAMAIADFLVVVAAVLLATLLYAAFNQVLRHPSGRSLNRSLGGI